ncbi:unnamed protein product [Gadus morhua 'NCC']
MFTGAEHSDFSDYLGPTAFIYQEIEENRRKTEGEPEENQRRGAELHQLTATRTLEAPGDGVSWSGAAFPTGGAPNVLGLPLLLVMKAGDGGSS